MTATTNSNAPTTREPVLNTTDPNNTYVDTSEQLAALARRLNDKYNTLPMARPDTITLRGAIAEVNDWDFHQIPDDVEPSIITCIDGGNAPICRSPAFTASLNRVACAAFRGSARADPPAPPRVQFLSLMRNVPSGGRVKREFELFADGAANSNYIPNMEMLEGAAGEDVASEDADSREHRLYAIARGLAEWLMATAAVPHMSKGSIIVRDGALNTWGGIEENLKKNALGEASLHEITMCGLSKTTGLLMDSGRPLVDYVDWCGKEKGAWYVPLGDALDGEGDYGTFMVRLHPKSKYIYRLDIDSASLKRMDAGGAGRLVASLAANSGDAQMPGYPYGLVEADRWARVRKEEAKRYSNYLYARLGPALQKSMDLQGQHDTLNEVAL